MAIQDIQTVTEAFVEFLEQQGIGTFGVDIYIGAVPGSLETQDSLYWLVTTGGSPIQRLQTGETVKQYFISVYYRSKSGKDIERKLFALEELLNCSTCVQLTGFEVISVEATQFPTDTDVDDEERRVGFLQANIQTYKKEC